MNSIVFSAPDKPCRIMEIPKPEPGENEVLVKVVAAALNRRDLWIKKGIYAASTFPCTPGSDAAGIIEKTGKNADASLIGKEVIINPGINWGNNQDYHDEKFTILGLPAQGTLAEYVCVPAENIFEKPAGFSFEKAAAIPLAGLTAYRALFYRGKLEKDQNVLITGAGGGVAVFLLKFAVAAGANVYVTSGSDKKIKKAIQLGATDGALYKEPNWDSHFKDAGGFDLIVDSAAGENFDLFPSLLKLGGKIVIFGGTAGKIPAMTAAKIFWKQASILGTTMGSNQDFMDMLSFIKQNRIDPEIDKIFPMEDAELAFKHMENHEQFGKIVIKTY